MEVDDGGMLGRWNQPRGGREGELSMVFHLLGLNLGLFNCFRLKTRSNVTPWGAGSLPGVGYCYMCSMMIPTCYNGHAFPSSIGHEAEDS